MTSTESANLTPKQQRFVLEYLVDLNATQAAIRAGYSEKTASVQAFDLLRKPNIQQAITKARDKTAKKLEITRERIIAEYAKLGFSDMREIAKWGPRSVTLMASTKLSDDAAAAISEVSQQTTTTGRNIKVKLHDKKAALDSLAKMLGFTDGKADPADSTDIDSIIQALDGSAAELWADAPEDADE